MAKLYGTLQSEKTGKNTRTANLLIEAAVQSWNGSISVSLNASGDVLVKVGEGSTDNPSKLVMYTTIKELLQLAAKGDMIRL